MRTSGRLRLTIPVYRLVMRMMIRPVFSVSMSVNAVSPSKFHYVPQPVECNITVLRESRNSCFCLFSRFTQYGDVTLDRLQPNVYRRKTNRHRAQHVSEAATTDTYETSEGLRVPNGKAHRLKKSWRPRTTSWFSRIFSRNCAFPYLNSCLLMLTSTPPMPTLQVQFTSAS